MCIEDEDDSLEEIEELYSKKAVERRIKLEKHYVLRQTEELFKEILENKAV